MKKLILHESCFLVRAAFLCSCLTIFVFTGTSANARSSDSPYRVTIQNDVNVKMRDGVFLVADIYRPQSDVPVPALVERTPYNRKDEADMAFELASHGYVVVLEDTRGRYDSGGEFYPFRDESNDGYDTIEWAAQQPGVNGKVGMFGGSYVGATQMLAAMARPPHLIAIFPFVTGSEYYEGWTYQSGVLMQWFTSSWSSILAVDTLRRRAAAASPEKDWMWISPLENYPIVQFPAADKLAPYFLDWLKHDRDDAYWQPWRVSDHYRDMKVAGLHAAGWHDIFLKGSIKNYTGLHTENSSAAIRNGQRLIIGPWAHTPTSPEGKIGDVVFGKNAVLDLTGTALKWFDYVLKGIQNEYAFAQPVRLFIMGENVWRDENEFPLARTKYTKYYLHSAHGANGGASDGTLDLAVPHTEPADHFAYDPSKPVPTLGGRLCCGKTLPVGPYDQRPNESRSDVLIFSTPPLTKDLEVTGFVSVELFGSTSTSDTDFTALLADVDESGYARFLTDGIVRARYRGLQPEAITPGRVYKFNIDLWATGNVFQKGHRVRLYISSSNFPRFRRNMNTGPSESTESVVARQTIYHDERYRSSLILPVIPRN
ncbi:MAG TPA: CocE/NonD family hydrolase [Pyrinomonadaceae bacterium]